MCGNMWPYARTFRVGNKTPQDWEQGLQRQDVYDYTPNVFDHEPRPYQIPQVSSRPNPARTRARVPCFRCPSRRHALLG
jgi:hypothetical protein